MPLNLAEVLALNIKSFLSEVQPTLCFQCVDRLHESTTGARPTKNGYSCSDCYFDSLGDAVENYPIGTPRRHVGA